MNPDMGAKRYMVRTLGCKANSYDSQLLEAELQRRGWKPAAADSPAELCVINSCTVTDEADRQSRRMASKFAATHPGATVVITGCAAEVDPDRLATSAGVSYVVGNSDKPRLVELVLEARKIGSRKAGEVLGQVRNYDEIRSRHPMDREWPSAEEQFPSGVSLREGHNARTRGFLKIQEGCNSFCTYCIIPYGRGPARSQQPERVLGQVRELVAKGVRELILTGTNLGEYGTEWSPEAGPSLPNGVGLEKLVRRVIDETRVERIRLGSLDPTEITPGLIELVRESGGRLCPHFHVSVQSPDTRILRAMKRRYTYVEVERTLQRIRDRLPDAFVGMDLITGFPGEGPDEFDRTVRKLEALPWSRIHVFPYSERSGTPATRLQGAVPQAERLRRARVLNELGRNRMRQWLTGRIQASGGILNGVLIERPVRWGIERRTYWSGYTADYLRVLIPYQAGPTLWNQTVSVRCGALLEDAQAHEIVIEGLEITGFDNQRRPE